jgi:hypothetical protein
MLMFPSFDASNDAERVTLPPSSSFLIPNDAAQHQVQPAGAEALSNG